MSAPKAAIGLVASKAILPADVMMPKPTAPLLIAPSLILSISRKRTRVFGKIISQSATRHVLEQFQVDVLMRHPFGNQRAQFLDDLGRLLAVDLARDA